MLPGAGICGDDADGSAGKPGAARCGGRRRSVVSALTKVFAGDGPGAGGPLLAQLAPLRTPVALARLRTVADEGVDDTELANSRNEIFARLLQPIGATHRRVPPPVESGERCHAPAQSCH